MNGNAKENGARKFIIFIISNGCVYINALEQWVVQYPKPGYTKK